MDYCKLLIQIIHGYLRPLMVANINVKVLKDILKLMRVLWNYVALFAVYVLVPHIGGLSLIHSYYLASRQV